MLEVINGIRSDPAKYSQKILELADLVKIEDQKIIFDKNGTRVGLNRGVEHFKTVAALISEKTNSPDLELREDICSAIPLNFDL